MTIWTGQTDPVKPEDMVFVRDNFDVSRIFYDAYDSLIDPLLEAIGKLLCSFYLPCYGKQSRFSNHPASISGY